MYSLDRYQLDAVKAISKSTMIVAPPGSGKTTVILNRVNYLLENNIDIKNIIILTFTKSAAENMKNRFITDFKKENAPFFGTFHGMFYKILARYHGKIEIINTYEAYGVIKKVLQKFNDEISDDKVKEILNNISLKKSSYDGEFTPTVATNIFEACFESYESYKEYKNLLDFDDLQKRGIELLKENPNMLNGYKNLFKYILVDEFQDCDNTQVEFLRLMNANLFAVGDEDQCIYSFRGSNPAVIVDFEKEFLDAKKIYLKYNYRSKKDIVAISKKVIEKNIIRDNKDIIGFKEESGLIDIVIPYDESEQGKKIAEKIKISSAEDELYSDNAILYRTNLESRNIIDRLIKEKIPFRLLDKEFNFFNHFVCQDIIAYLKLALDPTDKEAFIRAINKPYRYISKGVIKELKEEITVVNCFDFILQSKDIHPFQVKKIEDLAKDIANLNRLTLRTAIDFILSDLEYLDYIKEYSNKYNQKAEDLFDMIEEFKEAAKEFNKIIPFFAHVKDIEENIVKSKAIKQDAVILSTIHGVKGMEFKNVHVINCVDEMIPHKNATNLEEERRIFYVALTRAIETLNIYIPKTCKNDFKEQTPFLKGIIEKVKTAYTGDFKVGQRVHSNTNGHGTVEEVKDGIVTIIFGNVLKRFSIKTVVQAGLIKIV